MSMLWVHRGRSKINKEDREIFSIDKERGVICFYIEYMNRVGLAWITTSRGKSPGFLPHNHKLCQKYPDFSLFCTSSIKIMTHEIPLAIEMHFKLKYKLFIIGDKMQEINDFDGIWDLNLLIGNAQVCQ